MQAMLKLGALDMAALERAYENMPNA